MPTSILFLCIANSARSQMAEGLLRHLAGEGFDVHSAGLMSTGVRPEAVEVMREIGVDIGAQRSKTADSYAGRDFDLVVTTCEEAKEACPLFPGAKRMLHWDIPDPAGAIGDRLAPYRRARDLLKARIEEDLLRIR